MIQPVSVLFADYLSERCLVSHLNRILLEWLLQCSYSDLWPTLIIIDKLLFTNYSPRSKESYLLLLKLLALEVEQTE